VYKTLKESKKEVILWKCSVTKSEEKIKFKIIFKKKNKPPKWLNIWFSLCSQKYIKKSGCSYFGQKHEEKHSFLRVADQRPHFPKDSSLSSYTSLILQRIPHFLHIPASFPKGFLTFFIY
jgi:hypothetical protein